MLLPTITTTAAATATGVGAGYAQFAASLGIEAYKVKRLFLQANNLAQLRHVFTYEEGDANGNKERRAIVLPMKIMRDTPALDVDLKDKPLLLDGDSGLSFDLNPNERLLLLLDVEKVSPTLSLPGEAMNETVAAALSLPAFFADYTQSL